MLFLSLWAAGFVFGHACGGGERTPDRYGDPLPQGALVRTGTIRFRHELPVASIHYAPDGKTLASIGADQTVRIWDAKTGQPRLLIRLPDNSSVPHFAFSLDSDLFALGIAEFKETKWVVRVEVREASQGQVVRQHLLSKHKYQSPPVAFSPDRKTLAVGSNGSVFLWKFGSGTAPRKVPLQRTEVLAVAFTPDGKTLAAGGVDWEDTAGNAGMIHLVSVPDGVERHALALPGPWRGNQCLSISADGKSLAAPWIEDPFLGLFEGVKTALWDIASGKRIRLQDEKSLLRTLQFAPRGSTLLSLDNRAMRLRDAASGQEIRAIQHAGMAVCAAFSPDGKTLAWGDDHAIRLYDLTKGKELADSPSHGSAVTAVAFSPNGKELISAGDHSARIWDIATGLESQRVISPAGGHQEAVLPRLLGELLVGNAPLRSSTLSSDGRMLATGAAADTTLRVFDVRNGKQLHELKGRAEPIPEQLRRATFWNHIGPVAFSHDGNALAWANVAAVPKNSTSSLMVWDVPKKQAPFEPLPLEPSYHLTALNFSPDGAKLSSTYAWSLRAEGGIHVYTARTGAAEWTWADEQQKDDLPDRGIYSQAFSPDAKMLVVGNGHGIIRLFSAATGKPIRHFKGHDYVITALTFSGDGRWLASGDRRGILRIWDMEAGAKRELERQGPAGISCLAFSSDGARLASGLWDTTSLVWDLPAQFKRAKE